MVGVLTVAACNAASSPSPSHAPSPGTTASPVPTKPAASPSATAGAAVTLTDAADQETPVLVDSVAASPDRVAIVGRLDRDGAPSVLVIGSGDGTSWRRLDVSPIGRLVSLGLGPRGWVLVGARPGTSYLEVATVWTSSDGLTWSAVPGDAGLEGFFTGPTTIVAGGAGYAMVGQVEVDGTSTTAVWMSADGASWLEASNLRGLAIDQAVVLDDRVLAIESGANGSAVSMHQMIDGPLAETIDTSSFAGPAGDQVRIAWAIPFGHQVQVLSVNRSDGAVVAATASLDGPGLNAWAIDSDVGRRFGDVGLAAMRSSGASALVLGWDRDTLQPRSWAAEGPASWSGLQLDPATFDRGVPSQVAATNQAYFAVGSAANLSGDVRATIWRSSDGQTWERIGGDILGALPADPSGPCPAAPPADVEGFMSMSAALWPTCFGADELTIRGYTADCGGCGGTVGGTGEPAWLFDPLGYSAFWMMPAVSGAKTTEGGGFGVDIDPAHPIPVPAAGLHVALTGHFDDPASATCRFIPFRGYVAGLAAPAVAVSQCRREFVASSLRLLPN